MERKTEERKRVGNDCEHKMGKEKNGSKRPGEPGAHPVSSVLIYYSYLHIVTKFSRLVIVHDLIPYASGLRYTCYFN